MNDDLPALPEPRAVVDIWGHDVPQYTRDQMRAYARAAVAQRDEQIARLTAEVEALRAKNATMLEALEDVLDTGFTGGPQGKRARAAIDAARADAKPAECHWQQKARRAKDEFYARPIDAARAEAPGGGA